MRPIFNENFVEKRGLWVSLKFCCKMEGIFGEEVEAHKQIKSMKVDSTHRTVDILEVNRVLK